MASTPRAAAPERAPPPVPQPQPPPPEPEPEPPRDETQAPSPGVNTHEEAPPRQETDTGTTARSPPLSPVRLPTPHRLLPPNSPTGNGQEGAGAPAPPPGGPQLRLAGLDRTPSHGSLAKSPSPSPSPTPPSPLTPGPAHTANSKSDHSTPKRAEAWKPPASPFATAIAVQFDPVAEAITSPLRVGKARLDQQRAAAPATENGCAAPATTVPRGMPGVAAVGVERRTLSVALRVATAVLSLASFSVMASDRTSGWAGDHYGRYEEYRYAVGVNVIVCVCSIAQAFGEIRRLVSRSYIFGTTSSYYFSLFLDQVLAYLLMSASSAAASRNDLWVSRFGKDPFTKKINSSVWLSFLGFLALAANSVISTANLFSNV